MLTQPLSFRQWTKASSAGRVVEAGEGLLKESQPMLILVWSMLTDSIIAGKVCPLIGIGGQSTFFRA